MYTSQQLGDDNSQHKRWGAAIMARCQANLPEEGGVADNMPQRQAEALHDVEDAVALLQRNQPPRI